MLFYKRQLDVVNFINDIQDEDTRKLIVYRFVKGKGWREAARAKFNYYLILVFRMHVQKRSRATDLKDPHPTSVISILMTGKIIKRPEMGAFL